MGLFESICPLCQMCRFVMPKSPRNYRVPIYSLFFALEGIWGGITQELFQLGVRSDTPPRRTVKVSDLREVLADLPPDAEVQIYDNAVDSPVNDWAVEKTPRGSRIVLGREQFY